MIDILKKLNEGKDRCVLIGRNALNMTEPHKGEAMFHTLDYDVVCPDLQTARECQVILEKEGFLKESATFKGSNGEELDVLLADPQYPQSVVGEYYNIPSLRPLWDERENNNGVLVPDTEKLIMHKLLYARENEGKDSQTIGIYFQLNPEKFDAFLEKIDKHSVLEERDRMLFALYEGVADDKGQRDKIERFIASEIEKSNVNRDERMATV